MSKNRMLFIRVEPEFKKVLKLEAKKEERTLSNYVMKLIEKARGKNKKKIH